PQRARWTPAIASFAARAGGKLEMPALEELFPSLLVDSLPFIRFDVDPSLTADVGEVRRDRTGTTPAAGDFHHDLRSPPYRSGDLGNLPRGESVPPLGPGLAMP